MYSGRQPHTPLRPSASAFWRRTRAYRNIERMWVENLYTAEGHIMHERVDSGRSESRGDVRLVFSLPLRSLRLGLSGKADSVEFIAKRMAEGAIGPARPSGGLSLWSISADGPKPSPGTEFSFALRPSVWKRCWRLRRGKWSAFLRQDPPSGGTWSSTRTCASKPRKRPAGCMI